MTSMPEQTFTPPSNARADWFVTDHVALKETK
jgi:hypothetical protein